MTKWDCINYAPSSVLRDMEAGSFAAVAEACVPGQSHPTWPNGNIFELGLLAWIYHRRVLLCPVEDGGHCPPFLGHKLSGTVIWKHPNGAHFPVT